MVSVRTIRFLTLCALFAYADHFAIQMQRYTGNFCQEAVGKPSIVKGGHCKSWDSTPFNTLAYSHAANTPSDLEKEHVGCFITVFEKEHCQGDGGEFPYVVDQLAKCIFRQIDLAIPLLTIRSVKLHCGKSQIGARSEGSNEVV